MRFDLIVNQFVLQAVTTGKLAVYQDSYRRFFVHVRDVARAMLSVLNAPIEKVRNQVFNVGSECLNTTKQELVLLIRKDLPGLKVEHLDSAFCNDLRSIHVSFKKIRTVLHFDACVTLDEGIAELLWAVREGIIRHPANDRYRNHPPIEM